MKHSEGLSRLARLILATLEEAGEDDLVALINTVTRRHGSAEELATFRAALSDLLSRNLLDIARLRDDVSRQWIPLSKAESLSSVAHLGSLMNWSSANHLWNAPETTPRLQVVLTDAGVDAAREVLSRDGWPAS